MTSKLLLPFVTLVLGLGFGYLLSDHRAPSASSRAEASASASPSQITAASKSGAGGKIQTASMIAELEAKSETYADKVKRLSSGMGKAEIEAEIRKLATNPKMDASYGLQIELMRAWARLDPESAWNYAMEQTKPVERQRLLEAVAGELAKTNPMEALKKVLSLASPALKKSAVRKLFEDWSQVDGRAAVNYWNTHPELPADYMPMGMAFSNLGRTDPALAAELALNCRSTSSLSFELTGALRNWLETDAGAAVRWAESQTDPATRDKALAAAAQGLMNIDPKLAWETVAKVGSAGAAKDLTSKLVSQWMDIDPGSAMAYFAGLPEEDAKGMAYSIGSVLGRMSPQDQRQLLGQLPEGPAKSTILSSVIRSDSEAGRYADGIGLVNAMPEGRERDSSLHGVVAEWASKDPAATWKWIQQQPDSSDRDLATAAYAANLARKDPQAALQLVQAIPDKTLQHGALKNVYAGWVRNDPAAANAWLDAQPTFSDRERKAARDFSRIGSNMQFLVAPSVGKGR